VRWYMLKLHSRPSSCVRFLPSRLLAEDRESEGEGERRTDRQTERERERDGRTEGGREVDRERERAPSIVLARSFIHHVGRRGLSHHSKCVVYRHHVSWGEKIVISMCPEKTRSRQCVSRPLSTCDMTLSSCICTSALAPPWPVFASCVQGSLCFARECYFAEDSCEPCRPE